MTIEQMFGQCGVLVLLGMAVVFTFLILLVFAISGTGALVRALGWDKEDKKTGGGTASGVDGNVVAAISAAIKTYKENN
ncbi:MAG: OadG family protein [Spirochaetaceae bacterium]|jgi:sodium pump decarboxylase gamma subunit|nr:OadG family protein [Spirochaetaceae bacterium]